MKKKIAISLLCKVPSKKQLFTRCQKHSGVCWYLFIAVQPSEAVVANQTTPAPVSSTPATTPGMVVQLTSPQVVGL